MPESNKTPDVSSLKWWTVREVANLLRYDTSTIRRWCETKKIDAARMPGGTWRIHQSAVDKLTAGGLPEKRRIETAPLDPAYADVPDHLAAFD